MTAVEKPFERLRRARISAGYKSASAAARAHGWNEAAYRHHENGTRGYNYEQASQYAKAFGSSPTWLLDFSVAKSDEWRIPLGKFYSQSLGPRLSWKRGVEEAANLLHEELGLFFLPELIVSAEGIDPVEDEGGYPLFHFTSPRAVGIDPDRIAQGYLFYTRVSSSLAPSIVEPGDLVLVDSEHGLIKGKPQLWLLRNFDDVHVCWAARGAGGTDIALPDAAGGEAIPLDVEVKPLGVVVWIAKSL